MVILGALQANFWFGFLAATTLIFGAAYTLWMVKRVYFGDVGNHHVAELTDINKREFLFLSLLAIMTLAVGLYPLPLTEMTHATVTQLLAHLAQSKIPGAM
jgi:NADH-quinone oxidoreductase subunit M